MIDIEPAAHRVRVMPATSITGVTIYGCGADEAMLIRELAPRFVIVPTITEAVVAEESIDLVSGNTCISVSHKARITPALLTALNQAGVRYISTRSIGCDHIDVTYAASVGITVGNVAYSPDSVADYTVMLMLMAVRRARSTICRAAGHDFRLNDVRGRELRDMTVGVIGTGRIGAAVVARLRGFGGRIVAYDHRPKIAAEYVSLDTLVEQSDLVTLHTPLTPETHHLLNRQRIGRLKHGAFVINTGRGALIDTVALIDALEVGRLGGAALDVLEGEEAVFYRDCRAAPLAHHLLARLEALPNVIITPHTAFHTDHALRDTVEQSLANCLAFASTGATAPARVGSPV